MLSFDRLTDEYCLYWRRLAANARLQGSHFRVWLCFREATSTLVTSLFPLLNIVEVVLSQQLQATSLPREYADDEAAIARQANSLHASALKLFHVVGEYEKAFTQQGAEKFYRAVGKKGKWSLTMLDKIDRYRADAQANSLSLRLMLERTNLSMTARALETQSKAFQALQDQRDQMQLHYQSLSDHVQRLENTVPSVRQIEDVVRSQVSSLTSSTMLSVGRRLLAYPPQHAYNTLPIPIATQTSHQHLLPATRQKLQVRWTPPLGDGNSTLSRYASPGGHQTGSMTLTRHFPRDDRLSGADAMHGAVQISSEPPSANFFHQEAHAVSQIAIGIVSLIQNLALLYPHVLLLLHLIQVKLGSIPRSISGLLSDNIVLTDFLGRQHSLQYCYFKEWSVVYPMMRTTFEDCRGFHYILTHQFILETQLTGNRFQPFNPQSWSQLKPGARVIMSARLSKVPFSAGICTRCGERVFSTPRKTWICNTCNINFRSLDPEVLPASSELLEQATRLAPSALGHTLRARNARRSSRRFDEYHERIAVAKWRIDWSGHVKGILHNDDSPKTPPQVSYEQFVGEVYRIWRRRAAAYQRLSAEKANADQPFLGILENYRARKNQLLGQVADHDREMRDLQYFKHVSLRERALLHDAALKGDMALLKRLTTDERDLLTNRGPWGTPMDAAVLSGSIEAVEFLLRRGANPMARTGVLGSPIRAAALKGYYDVLHLLLDWSWDQCVHDSTKFLLFQNAVDRALVVATKAQHNAKVLEVLLFYGADPFRMWSKGNSAFEAAYKGDLLILLELFILAARERRILGTETARILLLKMLNSEQADMQLQDTELDLTYAGFRAGTSWRFENVLSKRWERARKLPTSPQVSLDEGIEATRARNAIEAQGLTDQPTSASPVTPVIVVDEALA